MRVQAACLVLVLITMMGPAWGHDEIPSEPGKPGPGPAESGREPDVALEIPAPRDPGGPLEVADQVVALLSVTDPQAVRQLVDDLARRHNLRVLYLYPLFSLEATLAVFLILDRRAPSTVAGQLRKESEVTEADLNHLLETQSDPHKLRQYALGLVGAERVHTALRGRNILVGLVDTGVDGTHEDLRGALAAQENLVEGTPQTGADMHGTAVAGLVAARKDNGLGIVGMAPEAGVVALQACVPRSPGAAEATCAAHRVARGIDLAVRYRTQILNLSLGGPPNRIVNRLVLQAIHVHNVMVVAAAGNNGPNGPALYPAALPGVIAVSATDSRDLPYKRSNMGRHLTILAPGVDILAPVPGDRYLFVTGTSYAAAHVSGALAILLEAKRDPTTTEVMAALKSGPVPDGSQRVGRLDLCRSLEVLGKSDFCR